MTMDYNPSLNIMVSSGDVSFSLRKYETMNGPLLSSWCHTRASSYMLLLKSPNVHSVCTDP